MKSLVCWVCFLVGPCTWEPGQGVPGCRGGLRPFLLCSCSCLVFKRLPQEWSYLSFHLFTCTMGFAPIKWTCTALFRPWQLTDRAILANRQPQEKKIQVSLVGELERLIFGNIPKNVLVVESVTPLAQGVSVQAVLQLIIALRVSRCLFLSFDCVSFGVLCSARVSSGASCVGWAQS